MRRFLMLLILGPGGFAVLIGLGTWQVQRLAWKTDILARIEARIVADPVALPAAPAQDRDIYLPVAVSGRFTGEEVRVLASQRGAGTGIHPVAVFETDDGRRILVDRGFIPDARAADPRPPVAATVTGNLHWPADRDSFTPPPDTGRNLWFARDVPAMAASLGTEPLLVVVRSTTEPEPPATPVPVGTEGIPNNHLEYAITWFLLAVVWAGMTGFLLWRIRRERTEGRT